MAADPRHRAWDDIHGLLPVGWHVGPTTYEPGRRRWTVVARGPNTGNRLRPPQTIAGEGEDELHALTELALALRAFNRQGQLADIERRARIAYLAGAEEWSHSALGRGLRVEELHGVIERYSETGDQP